MATPSLNKSSANLVRSMILGSSSPAVSIIAADLASHSRSSAFMAPSPRLIVSDGAFARPQPDPATLAAQKTAVDEEREYLVRRLAEVEASKDHELDHVRMRVSKLTTRVAELEASLSVAHRALEEEAATAMGLQRRVDVLQMRHAMSRWRERMSKRNLVRLAHQTATFVDGVDAAASLLPGASGGTAPPVRKALEELTWCERQWTEHRIAYLQRSLEAFRCGPNADHVASAPSPQQSVRPTHPSPERLRAPSTAADVSGATTKDVDRAVASMLASAKTLVERAEAITAARFQVLQQIFVSTTKCDEGKQQLEEAVLRFRRATGTTAAQTPPDLPPGDDATHARDGAGVRDESSGLPNRPAPATTGVLSKAAAYDVVRDGFASAVTVVVVPPLLHLVRQATIGCPVLPKVIDALEAMLLQQPLTVQVEQHLKALLNKHFTLHRMQQACHDDGMASEGAAASATCSATFYVEEPLQASRMLQATDASNSEVRRLMYPLNGPSSSVPVPITPAHKPLRWDLVHSVLDNDRASGGDGQQQRDGAATDGQRRYQQALRDSTDDQTSSSRLQRARRSLMQFNRANML